MFLYVGPAALSVVTVITLIGVPVGAAAAAADAAVYAAAAAAVDAAPDAAAVVLALPELLLLPHAAARITNARHAATAARLDRARWAPDLVICSPP